MNQDINGSACSVELYFGQDVLSAFGDFVPVQWRGYDDRFKPYQGEIRNEDGLQLEFLRKSEAARQDRNLIASQDWQDMRKLLNAIINALNA